MNTDTESDTDAEIGAGVDANTLVAFMYRDASNYKERDIVVFAGPPTPELLQRLWAATVGRCHRFVLRQVNVTNLAEVMPGTYDDDTNWHEIEDVAPVQDPATDPRTFEQFVQACEAVQRWDAQLDPERDDPHPPLPGDTGTGSVPARIDVTAGNGLPFRVIRHAPGDPRPGGGHLDLPAITIRDLRCTTPAFAPDGQFVAAYHLTDIADLRGAGLNLHGGVPAWRWDADTVALILDWLGL